MRQISSYLLSYSFSFKFRALINLIAFLSLLFFNKYSIRALLCLTTLIIATIFSKGRDLNKFSIISLLIYLSILS